MALRIGGRWVVALCAAIGVAALAVDGMTVDAAGVGATTGTVTVTGSGFGHGVGLSQYGALGMARAGASAAQILQHYYTGVDVAPVRDDVDVRVNVVHGGRSVVLGEAGLAPGGTWQVLPDGDAAALTLAAGDTVTVTPSTIADDRLALTVKRSGALDGDQRLDVASFEVHWSGTRAMPGVDSRVTVVSRSPASWRKVRSYRWGSLRVSPVGGAVEAVAVVGLHAEYLRGVAEMPSSWPPAALQVQVVAARNYALVAAGSTPRASCGGCQLWDDTRSQVYVGWAKEAERLGPVDFGARWVAAVIATQISAGTGLGVLYDGRPVTAYFASSTGGRTRNSADVWGTALPYLRSVDDPWSVDATVNPSYARWTRNVPVSRVLALFRLRSLASLTVSSRDAGGAAKVVTAIDGDGTVHTLSGNRFASQLGLPGAWVTSVSVPLPPTPSSSPASSPSGSSSPAGSASPSVLPSVAPVPVGAGGSAGGAGASSSSRPWSRFADRTVDGHRAD